jgi:hypothetical protein
LRRRRIGRFEALAAVRIVSPGWRWMIASISAVAAPPRRVNDQEPDEALPDQRPVADEEAAQPSAPPRDQALPIPRRGGEEIAADGIAGGPVDRRQPLQVDIVRWGDDNRLVAGGHDVGVGPPSERSFVHTSIFAHRVGPESASSSDGAWLGRACRAPEG